MSGIYLLIVVLIWLYVVKKIVRYIVNDKWPAGYKIIVQVFLFLVLMIAPVTDEVVAWFKFKELCDKNSSVDIDIKNAKNKTLKLRTERDPNNSKYIKMPVHVIKSALVPIIEESYEYIDPHTNKVVVAYKVFRVKGGWLINALGISNNDSPLLFNNVCYPADRFSIFRKYNINRTD